MTHREHPLHQADPTQLMPLSAAVFPKHWLVCTDRPQGLVAHANGLVGFEDTNVIIRVRGPHNSFPAHTGPLSILFLSGGQEEYELDGRRLVLDDRSYLVHNAGQIVGSVMNEAPAVESFTIGFWPGFAEEVLHSLVTPTDHLLDNLGPARYRAVHFFDQLYPHDTILSPLLTRLREALDQTCPTQGWLQEMHYLLLTKLLCVHRQVGAEIGAMAAVSNATRVEMYRRLHRALDFMEASLEQPLTIPQIAQAAWFSPYHFLRQFKQAFGETPHQYLTRRRLERAQHLLRNTEMSVTEICLSVGFESLGSFSWLFRQRLGCSPAKYRMQHHVSSHL